MSKKFKETEINSFLKQKKLNDEVLKALSLVLESMAEGVNVSNDKGVILYTNPAFDAMFGYNQNELIGKHISELTTYSAEKNAQIYKEINQILDAQKVWSDEFSNKKKGWHSILYESTNQRSRTQGQEMFDICPK
jgi:PAS domain S-box-containing protein